MVQLDLMIPMSFLEEEVDEEEMGSDEEAGQRACRIQSYRVKMKWRNTILRISRLGVGAGIACEVVERSCRIER